MVSIAGSKLRKIFTFLNSSFNKTLILISILILDLIFLNPSLQERVPLWSAMHGGSGNDQEEEDGNQSENPPLDSTVKLAVFPIWHPTCISTKLWSWTNQKGYSVSSILVHEYIYFCRYLCYDFLVIENWEFESESGYLM